MFYLVIRNLGRERCIHMSEDDNYKEGMAVLLYPRPGV